MAGGAALTEELIREETELLAVGEMGIGNTTTATALSAALLNLNPDEITGRGAGLSTAGLERKKRAIHSALMRIDPNEKDPVYLMTELGGLDIAAMCGAFLGCAEKRCPVVIDGFISAVAALCAYKLCPNAVQYFIPSHASYEIGYKLAMDAMHLQPLFLLGMRLGEGSGCPLAFEILDAACAIINDMATFDQAGIDDGYLDEIREGDKFTVEGAK
jgi:nicotinate-nucleotide--dimethylbenzimidazole phosphoribosyltransferase